MKQVIQGIEKWLRACFWIAAFCWFLDLIAILPEATVNALFRIFIP